MIMIGDKELIFSKTVIAPPGVPVTIKEPIGDLPLPIQLVFTQTGGVGPIEISWGITGGFLRIDMRGPFDVGGFGPSQIGNDGQNRPLGISGSINASEGGVVFHIQFLRGGTYA